MKFLFQAWNSWKSPKRHSWHQGYKVMMEVCLWANLIKRKNSKYLWKKSLKTDSLVIFTDFTVDFNVPILFPCFQISFFHLFILQPLLYIKQLILTIYNVSVDICMHKIHEFLKNTYIMPCIQVIIILCKFEFLVHTKEIAHELENS